MDYIRNNINITCTAQDQILEFYIKLRLAVAKGGIYLRPIDNIMKDQSIAQNMLNKEAHQSQSNALYTILVNEKYIPKEFTIAQNCILGYSTTMDGFSALKAMLKLTHPVLNKKRPSSNPPTLNDSTDIHNYEQNLRNYYLLHRLYNKTEYPAILKKNNLCSVLRMRNILKLSSVSKINWIQRRSCILNSRMISLLITLPVPSSILLKNMMMKLSLSVLLDPVVLSNDNR